MSAMIARCPGCQTAFRVSAAQRAAAEGLVRCGVCARVFRAELYLVDDEPVPGWQPDAQPPADSGIEESYVHEMLAEGEPTGEATYPALDHAPQTTDLQAKIVAVSAAGSMIEDPARAATDAAPPGELVPVPAFTPPPIEIDAAPRPGRAPSAGWALGCVFAALALAAQYGWYERDRLLQHRTLRPWLERACAPLGCALPRPPAPQAIRSDALVIRPAPGRDGVLLLDALISNRGAYPQPWPGLAISFQDARGRTVAGRVFGAADYLPEAPREPMPAGPAIAVHLELRDPGEHASGYRMDILAPPGAR
ncbi:MAG: hypothetical protein CALGDGBN_03214 [Pseudomonadales bacterium]|nr:hypothetical protein [Pseudomonadales bacterium]